MNPPPTTAPPLSSLSAEVTPLPYYITSPPSSPLSAEMTQPPFSPLTVKVTPPIPFLTSQCLCVDDQACPKWPAFWGSWTAKYTGLPWRRTQCVSWSSLGTLDQFLHTWSPVVFQSSYRVLIQTVMNKLNVVT